MLLASFPFSCQQRQPTAAVPAPAPPPPVTPEPPTLAQQGDQYFDAGDYANAFIKYSDYLREQPNGSEGDRVLLRLALVHAMPGNAEPNYELATGYMRELIRRFPQSPLRTQAELYLHLQDQIVALRSEIAQGQIQVGVLSSQIAEMKQAGGEEMDQLRAGLKEREERVRQLSAELDQLKAIDMQRRTAPPPR